MKSVMREREGPAILVALVGAVFMGAIALNLLFPVAHTFIGSNLYDLYLQALLDGRFDLPMRELKFEGHFTPDGKGYVYYGLAPMIAHLPFLPFVDLPTTWISAVSIWIWSVMGNVAYHRAFWLALARGSGGAENIRRGYSILLAIAVWFAAPGLVLVGGNAVYREPIAMGYALGGGVILLLAMVAFERIRLEKAIVPMAVLAGLTVHARPNLAVGFYVTVCLAALVLLLRAGGPRWKPVVAAMAVLGLFGGGLLMINQLRFGNAMTMHGSFSESRVEYSSIFWGLESKEGGRARAFEEHGRFNAGRIVPNAMVYIASPPSNIGIDPTVEALERLHRRMIDPSDRVVVADPKAGMLFLWPVWMVFMAIGLFQRPLWRMPSLAGLIGVTISFLVMLSYPAITLRYHVDLWPMVGLPAVFGVAALARRAGEEKNGMAAWGSALRVLVICGLIVTVHKTIHSRVANYDGEGKWSADYCLELTAKKGFSADRSREICELRPAGSEA